MIPTKHTFMEVKISDAAQNKTEHKWNKLPKQKGMQDRQTNNQGKHEQT